MAVLSSAVIAAGVRAGQFVRYYETVAQLLTTTDSLAVGEIVRTPKYEYECVSTGEHATTAGGAKLKCLASPWVTPDQFGAPGLGSDETAYVMAAISSGLPVYLNRYYEVDNVYFPAGQDGIQIFGAGPHISGLKGRNASSQAILQTFETDDSATSMGHALRSFGIIGYGQRGLAVVQCLNSHFEMIHFVSANGSYVPNAFSGADTVVNESSFGNTFRNIQCGAGSTRSDFRVNACSLDTIVDLLYTNNASIETHIDIDQSRYEIAAWQSPGHSHITFNTATLQGARGYAIKVSGTESVKFHNLYLEAVNGALLVLDADHVYIDGSEITGNNSGHAVWLDQSKGAVTYNVEFVGCDLKKPVVAGNVRRVNMIGCAGETISDILFTDATYRLQEATYTSGSFQTQITSIGERSTTLGGTIGLKCTDGSKHTRIKVSEAGVVSAETAFDMAKVDHHCLTPVASVDGSGTQAWTSGVAITPITCRGVGGTGPHTFSISGFKFESGTLPTGVSIDSGTGTISGTPTETGEFRFRVRVTDADGKYDDSRLIVATVT